MRRLPIVFTVLTLAFAVPASAQAATLTFDRPCFAAVPGLAADQPITFTLTGGTPGYNWRVNADDFRAISTVQASGTFDAAGNARGSFPSYSVRSIGIGTSRGRQATFTATQGPNLFGQTPIAQGTATVTNTALTISRTSGRVFRKRTWKVSGLTPLFGSTAYYASWVKRGGKRVIKRAKLGTAKGACGYLSTKRVLPPARRSGAWTVYVHTGKKLDRKKAIAFPFRVFVF